MNLFLQTCCVLTVSLLLLGCDRSAELSRDSQRDIGTVVLEVDYGGEKSAKQIDVVCSPNSTVLLSLERA